MAKVSDKGEVRVASELMLNGSAHYIQLAEQAERYDEMVMYMKNVAKVGPQFFASGLHHSARHR
jgi:hypothetical protein